MTRLRLIWKCKRCNNVLQLMLLEVGTRHLVDFARIETRGGFLQFYKASPEDLLRPPLQDYTGQLLGR